MVKEASAAAKARVSVTWPSVATGPMAINHTHMSGSGHCHTSSAGMRVSGI